MKKLTRKEEEAMELFWEKGPLFVKEMLSFYPDPRPHFNTLSTVVRGLEMRGYVAHEAFGASFRYYAAVSREEYSKKTLKGIISKYFNDSYLGLVSTFVREENISLDELKELIREVENGGQK